MADMKNIHLPFSATGWQSSISIAAGHIFIGIKSSSLRVCHLYINLTKINNFHKTLFDKVSAVM